MATTTKTRKATAVTSTKAIVPAPAPVKAPATNRVMLDTETLSNRGELTAGALQYIGTITRGQALRAHEAVDTSINPKARTRNMLRNRSDSPFNGASVADTVIRMTQQVQRKGASDDDTAFWRQYADALSVAASIARARAAFDVSADAKGTVTLAHTLDDARSRVQNGWTNDDSTKVKGCNDALVTAVDGTSPNATLFYAVIRHVATDSNTGLAMLNMCGEYMAAWQRGQNQGEMLKAVQSWVSPDMLPRIVNAGKGYAQDRISAKCKAKASAKAPAPVIEGTVKAPAPKASRNRAAKAPDPAPVAEPVTA